MKRIIFVSLVALLLNSTSNAKQSELVKLVAQDGERDDYFGFSVAVSESTVLVGASGDDDNGAESGSAYLFHLDSGEQIAKLLPNPNAPRDRFGQSVALTETTALVGAPHPYENSGLPGAVYLFDTATGQQLMRLVPDDGDAWDSFGFSLDIDGTLALIGSPRHNSGGGAAYVFDTVTGEQLFKLTGNDSAYHSFGWAVALSGGRAIIGAMGGDRDFLGTTYLFDVSTGKQIVELVPDDASPGVTFGYDVAIHGHHIVVGAKGDYDSFIAGEAFLFDAVTGRQTAKLIPLGGEPQDSFGWDVGISGSTVIVSAFYDDNGNGTNAGAAYLFDISTGQQWSKLVASDGGNSDLFGSDVAITGTRSVVGAHRSEGRVAYSGSAYVFSAPTCTADLNEDGRTDIADFGLFLDEWIARNDLADWNGDESIDTQDVIAYLNDWAVGC